MTPARTILALLALLSLTALCAGMVGGLAAHSDLINYEWVAE